MNEARRCHEGLVRWTLAAWLCLLTCCGGGGRGQDCESDGDASPCNPCTFAAHGASCHPGTTRDLVDLGAIKALSLTDLGFAATSSVVVNGMSVVVGDFDSGTFRGVHVDGSLQDVQVPSRAALYVPDGWPQSEDPRKGFVYAAHFASSVLDPIAVAIARTFRIPVLYHGNHGGSASPWSMLGYVDREELYSSTIGSVITHNTCEVVDLTRGNFALALAVADMRAITLLQRLAERAGASIETVALRGYSKEGEGGWLAAVVDDRIEVGGFGGWPRQSRFGWLDSWIDAYGCAGGSEKADKAAGLALVKDWVLHTPAGAGWLNRFDIGLNQGLLRPRLILIDGDVHQPNMHDGKLSMLGGESDFLAALRMPHRYFRRTEVGPGEGDEQGDAASRVTLPVLLAEMLVSAPGSEDTYYPRVLSAAAVQVGASLMVNAEASAATVSASLWLSWSDDRIWNEEGQAPWVEFPLTKSGPAWSVEVDLAAQGGIQDKVLGWFVEARNDLVIESTIYPRRDASPVRFLNEPSPVVCDVQPEPFCAEGFFPPLGNEALGK